MITSPTWEKHQVWISAMSAHKFWQNTLPYRRKIMKVPPHSYGKFTTQLYHDQSSTGYIYIEPQQFWKGSVQLKPSTENTPPPPPTKTKLQRNYHIYGKRDVTNVCAFFYYKDPEQRNIKNETGERSAA